MTIKWKANNTGNSKYIGILEFKDNKGEWHNFEVLEIKDRLVFGGCCNCGFIESGYIEKDGMNTDSVLQGLLEDLECYYNSGPNYVSMIVCNERM